MTEEQRRVRAQIDAVQRYEKNAIERSFGELLDQLNKTWFVGVRESHG
jgi:hypothetical protein